MMLSSTTDAHFWDRIARKYATDPIKDTAGYERTLARTVELLSHSDNVLEIGCGTGTTALRLARTVRRLVATDVSSEMIAIAREKCVAQGGSNVEFVVAPAEGAPGDDGSYDAVLAFNVLHVVGARTAALARLFRLLRPGGLFISKTPCLTEMNPLIRLAVPVMRAIGQAPRRVAFFTASDLEREIAGVGFTVSERARHGSGRTDPRIFIVAKRPG